MLDAEAWVSFDVVSRVENRCGHSRSDSNTLACGRYNPCLCLSVHINHVIPVNEVLLFTTRCQSVDGNSLNLSY